MAQATMSFKLGDGLEMPLIGYGLGSANMVIEHKDVVSATKMALKNGFHHLDCAEAYGNEAAVGESIKASGVPRESLFITTKVTGYPGQDVESAFSTSLQKLGTDYVDLYLIHLPYVAPDEMPAFWSQLEAIHASGRARSIGVSNFLQKHLETLLQTAKIKPAINQIEYHPYLQHGDLVRYCQERDIPVSGYGALTAITKAQPGPVDDIYADLAAKYGVGENDIAIKWCIDQGLAVITTSSNPDRLNGFRNNLAKFTLESEEIQRISELGRKKHFRVVYNEFFAPDDRS